MNTLRVWLAFIAPLVVLTIGNAAARRPLPADPLARTMLGGCVRLSGPIRSTLRGIGQALRHAGRFALVGWVALIVVALVGWFVVAVVVSTVTVFDRAIIAGWVVAVAVAGRKPNQADNGPTDPMLDPGRWAYALRAVNPGKLAAKDKEGRWLNPFTVTPQKTVNGQGRSYRVRLPQGITASECESKADTLIHAFNVKGVPRGRWRVEMDGEVALLKVTILAPLPDLSTPRPPQYRYGTVKWSDPILAGRDHTTGCDYYVPTYDKPGHLLGGQSGFGKTIGLRLIAAHYACDPATLLWGFDGKDTPGWLLMSHRFARWVHHDTDETVTAGRLLDMLTDARQVMLDRFAAMRSGAVARRDLPGMLILLEELGDGLRNLSSADKATAEQRIMSLLAKCREANMTVLGVSQKPSGRQMDTDMRDLFGPRWSWNQPTRAAAVMVLDEPVPDDATSLPPGQAYIRHGKQTAKVVVDYFSDGSGGDAPLWERFCASLPAVPQWDAPEAPSGPQDAPAATPGPQDAPAAEDTPATPSVVTDTRPALFHAAGQSAQVEPDRMKTPHGLWSSLTPDMQPKSPRAMASVLNEHGWYSRENIPLHGVNARAYLAADYELLVGGGQPDYSNEGTRALLAPNTAANTTPTQA